MRSRAAWLIAGALSLSAAQAAFPWGFQTHRLINESAIETLPDGLRPFFAMNRARLSDLAVEPDTIRRREHGRQEAARHYMDLDFYSGPPFRDLPRSREAAVEKFGETAVLLHGTLPWTLADLHAALAERLRSHEWREAIEAAGLAGHYIADAFMPLHATTNHDGQHSGNRGIHGAIEESLVDRRLALYERRTRARIAPAEGDRLKSVPLPFTSERIHEVLIESFAAVPALLAADTEARRSGALGSERYVEVLDRRIGDLLAARLAEATRTVGWYWVSAWDAAGRPAPPSR